MKRHFAIFITVLLAPSLPAGAWVAAGHKLATELAVTAARPEMPAFFFEGRQTIAQSCVDPDYQRAPAMPQLCDAIYAEHYAVWETLKDLGLPRTRYDFLDRCAASGFKPRDVGLLPYAIAEATQRLTLAFAEYRAWPNDTRIQEKCLLYAGLLSHLAEDACQPLHTTAEFDGRRLPNGKLPRTGIHVEVDALIAKLHPPRDSEGLLIVPANMRPQVHENLMDAIFEQISRSNELVPAVYEMEAVLLQATSSRPVTQPGAAILPEDLPMPSDERVEAFARERLAACANFTTSLYLTAWEDSAKVKLPTWLIRARAEVDGPAASQPSSTTAPAK